MHVSIILKHREAEDGDSARRKLLIFKVSEYKLFGVKVVLI